MKNKKIILISVIIISWCFFSIAPKPVSATTIYKYLSDDAIVTWDTDTDGFGEAYVRHDHIDSLGVYTETSIWIDTAKAWIYINGGYYDADPWTFPSSGDYYWWVKWVITGNYDEKAGNYFYFHYRLYYMIGSEKEVVDTLHYEYTADFNYVSQTVSHYGGLVSLESGRTYYLDCRIELYHSLWSGYCESDIHDNDNEIDFTHVKFQELMK